MTYDGDLARFSRTDPAGNVRYSYGGLFDEFTDSAGTHYVMKIVAAGHPVAEVEELETNNMVKSTTVNAILVDALGSIDALVGSSGKLAPVKYDPFGARVQASDPTVHMTTAPGDLRAGFTGHDHDDDVDLIDMIGRVYDPVQQRFLSVDPPAPDPVDGQAYNPYAYVRNNPLNATDPTGYLEVLSEGVPFGTTDQDVYTQPPGWKNVTGPSPYGADPAANQGVWGTAGPGTISLGNFGAQLKLDPTLVIPKPPVDEFDLPDNTIPAPAGYAPPGTTQPSLANFQLDPLGTMYGWNAERNELWLRAQVTLTWLFGGTSRPTPQQIAWFTDQIWNNQDLGTCAPAAGMNAALGLMNGYGAQVDTMWSDVRHVGHAVTELTDGTTTFTLTWGDTKYASPEDVARALGDDPSTIVRDAADPRFYPHVPRPEDLMTPSWIP